MRDPTALIVVDMLIGFCRPGYPLSISEDTSKLEANIVQRVHAFQSSRAPVFFVCDAHRESDPEFQQFPRHCLKGTKEAEIAGELAQLAQHSSVVEKHTFSPFFETNLAKLLEKTAVTTVEVAGVCTDICVLFTIEELRNRNYQVLLKSNCVMASRPDRQKPALKYIRRILGATISGD